MASSSRVFLFDFVEEAAEDSFDTWNAGTFEKVYGVRGPFAGFIVSGKDGGDSRGKIGGKDADNVAVDLKCIRIIGKTEPRAKRSGEGCLPCGVLLGSTCCSSCTA